MELISILTTILILYVLAKICILVQYVEARWVQIPVSLLILGIYPFGCLYILFNLILLMS